MNTVELSSAIDARLVATGWLSSYSLDIEIRGEPGKPKRVIWQFWHGAKQVQLESKSPEGLLAQVVDCFQASIPATVDLAIANVNGLSPIHMTAEAGEVVR